MKVKGLILPVLFFIVVVSAFFYKTIFFGQIPFPGDLLVAEYNPWKSYSYLGYNPGSYPNKAQYFDVLRQIYPWKTLSISSFKNSSIPLWNPYNFSGSPLLANFQSAVFYPLNVLYFFIPQILAWGSLIIFQPFLTLLFTFFYCRKIRISRIGSIFGSISFAFSSFMSVWLEYNTIGHVILWFPLILLSLEKLFEKKSVIWSLILIFSLLSSLFAGHIQIFTYLLIFVSFYSLIRIKKLSLFLISLFVLSLGIGAIQLVPGIELIMLSSRSAHSYDLIINKILIQPWQIAMLFVPDFFGNPATRNYWISDTYIGKVTSVGLIPLFFVVLVLLRKKNQLVKFFLWMSFFILLFTTLNPFTYFFYKINFPFISGSAPTLSIFLLCFSLSILAGFGIDNFRKENWTFKKYLFLVFPMVIIFAVLWISLSFLPHDFLVISLRNLMYSTIIFSVASVFLYIAISNNRVKTTILVLLLILTTFDLWRSFQKFNPFVPSQLIYPKAPIFDFFLENAGINRIWGYQAASIDANFETQYSLFSPQGYDPLYPRRYGEFIQSSKEGKIALKFTDQTRSDATLGFGEKKVSDLLGVKYILDKDENASTPKTFPLDRYSLIYQEDGWKIFENKKALPRAFLVSNYKVVKSLEDFENIFFAKDLDHSKTVILEESLGDQKLNDSSNQGNVKVVSYAPNEVRLKTDADGNRLLFLSDTYYPGWKAYVDDRETKIYRANYAFRAIVIPSGTHSVKFFYDPLSFKLGYTISLASLALLAILLLAIKKKLKVI